MDYKAGQKCSRKKSEIVWKISKVSAEEVVLERSRAKDKTSTKTVPMKLFAKKWTIVN